MEELENEKQNTGWFKAENIFFDEYAKHLGHTASLVYLCIGRYMDIEDRTAFPSEKCIAEKLNLDRRTVIRAIKKLQLHRFIEKEKRRYKGRWEHNFYYLTYSEDWLIEPCDKNVNDNDNSENSDYHVTKMSYPSDKNDRNRVHKSHTNNTHNKNTKKKKIALSFKNNSP